MGLMTGIYIEALVWPFFSTLLVFFVKYSIVI